MDSLPRELHLTILSLLSVRDIHRLERTNKEWNKKTPDLSFLSTLDFSYSPDITDDDLKTFLTTRFKSSNATRVHLAFNRFLTESSLECLFSALPKLKDCIFRYCSLLMKDYERAFTIIFSQKKLETLKIRFLLNDSPKHWVNNPPAEFEILCDNLKCIDICSVASEQPKLPEFDLFSPSQRAYLIQRYPELYSRYTSRLEYHSFYWMLFHNKEYPELYGPNEGQGHLAPYQLDEEGVKQMLANTLQLLRSLPTLTLESDQNSETVMKFLLDAHQECRIQLNEEDLAFLKEHYQQTDFRRKTIHKYLYKLEQRPYNELALIRAVGELYWLACETAYGKRWCLEVYSDLTALHPYIEYFYKTNRKMPSSPDTHYWITRGLALIYMHKKNYVEALRFLSKRNLYDEDHYALAKHLVTEVFRDNKELPVEETKWWPPYNDQFSSVLHARYTCQTCDVPSGTCSYCANSGLMNDGSECICNLKPLCWTCVNTCHKGHNVIFRACNDLPCVCSPHHGDCDGVDKFTEVDYLPASVRNNIAQYLTVNDVHNLNTSCKRSANTFSIQELLDLSFSPYMTHDDFVRLLDKLERDQIAIKKVVLAHNNYLTQQSVDLLFTLFPSVTDIRIRHCPKINLTVLKLLLRQPQLTSIRLNMDQISCSGDTDLAVRVDFDIRCTKLHTLKIKNACCLGFSDKNQVRQLLENNHALKNDLNLMRHLARHNNGDESLIDLALESNDTGVFKSLWDYFKCQSSAAVNAIATVSVEKYAHRTIQHLKSHQDDELINNNHVSKICKEILKHSSSLSVVHENQVYLSKFNGCRCDKTRKLEAKKAKRPFKPLKLTDLEEEYQYDLNTEFPLYRLV